MFKPLQSTRKQPYTMIPAGIDIDDLARQVEEDSVAFDPLVPAERIAEVEPGLIDAALRADASDFGSLGVVVLGESPAHAPDLRDVAQDVLLASGVDTVIVRAPESGAVVSEVHSRAALESAQYPFLGNPDIVEGVHGLIDDLSAATVNWPSVMALIIATLVAGAAFAAVGARRPSTPHA